MLALFTGYKFSYTDGNCYIIDENGNHINKKGYKEIRTGFSENGLATVLVENRWKPGSLFYHEYLLLVDTSGKVKYKTTADDIYTIINNTVPRKDRGSFAEYILNDDGKVIYKVPSDKYIYCDSYNYADAVPFSDGEDCLKYGLVNMKDEVLIEPIYKYVWPVDENGLVRVQSEDGKYGLFRENGDVVVDPIYKSMSDFCEGIAVVELDDGTNGYIDTNGEFVIDPIYEYATDFSDGLAIVRNNGESFYIDHTGQKVMDCGKSSLFNEGFAKVLGDNNFYAYMDKSGKLITDYIYPIESDLFCNGFARIQQGGLKGFIDQEGSVVFEAQFRKASPMGKDGHATVQIESGLWGYINSDGTWLLEPVFLEATDFHDGVALVKVAEE